MGKKITAEMLNNWAILCDLASPEPWEADIDDPNTDEPAWTGKFYCGDLESDTWETWEPYGGAQTMTIAQEVANARFVAAARTAMPLLIAEVQRLRQTIALITKTLELL